MHSTAERRQMILQFLCERRSELAENLAVEFGVTTRTIYKDIEILAYSYPIYTVQGVGGGIRIMDGFRLGMKYLTDKQYEILYQISERLDGEEKVLVSGILKTFAYPKKGTNGKKSST